MVAKYTRAELAINNPGMPPGLTVLGMRFSRLFDESPGTINALTEALRQEETFTSHHKHGQTTTHMARTARALLESILTFNSHRATVLTEYDKWARSAGTGQGLMALYMLLRPMRDEHPGIRSFIDACARMPLPTDEEVAAYVAHTKQVGNIEKAQSPLATIVGGEEAESA